MRPCRFAGPLLSGYVDRELAPRETTVLREHLHSCRSCRADVAAERDLQTRIRASFDRFRELSHPRHSG